MRERERREKIKSGIILAFTMFSIACRWTRCVRFHLFTESFFPPVSAAAFPSIYKKKFRIVHKRIVDRVLERRPVKTWESRFVVAANTTLLMLPMWTSIRIWTSRDAWLLQLCPRLTGHSESLRGGVKWPSRKVQLWQPDLKIKWVIEGWKMNFKFKDFWGNTFKSI